MNTQVKDLLVREDPEREVGTSRRSFLQKAAIAGAFGAVGTGSFLTVLSQVRRERALSVRTIETMATICGSGTTTS